MFIMLVYDVPSDRTGIFRKIGRRYLGHQQASVFWGALPESKCKSMINELKREIDHCDDVTLILAANRNNVEIVNLKNSKSAPGEAAIQEDTRHRMDSEIL